MKYKTVLITPGGAGTHLLSDLLGLHVINNGQLKFSRHRRNPNITDVTNVVYLYSNPYDTILSFYRRGFFKNIQHCKHIDGDVKTMEKNLNISLLDFLKLKTDPFGIEEHFHKYFYFDERKYDIMFVKYESLPININFVLEWFNSEDKIKNFNFKKRNSDWNYESLEVKKQLEDKYGTFKNFVDTLPNIIIRNKNI